MNVNQSHPDHQKFDDPFDRRHRQIRSLVYLSFILIAISTATVIITAVLSK